MGFYLTKSTSMLLAQFQINNHGRLTLGPINPAGPSGPGFPCFPSYQYNIQVKLKLKKLMIKLFAAITWDFGQTGRN